MDQSLLCNAITSRAATFFALRYARQSVAKKTETHPTQQTAKQTHSPLQRVAAKKPGTSKSIRSTPQTPQRNTPYRTPRTDTRLNKPRNHPGKTRAHYNR